MYNIYNRYINECTYIHILNVQYISRNICIIIYEYKPIWTYFNN